MTTSRWVLALTSAAAFMVALDQLVVATALTTMQRDLHASLATLEWTVNAYSLTFAVLLMTGAALGDRLGRRRILVAGLGLFTASSALCALAPSVGWLIAARTLQGAGAALVMPVTMAMLTSTYPIAQRGRALGIFTGLTGLAVVFGPVIGGAVTEGLAWQWIFWLNVPIGLAVMPLVLTRTLESRGPKRRLDLGGVVLVTGAAFGLVWGLIRGNTAGWASPEVLCALVGGVVLLGLFVGWELRVAAPMLPMRFFAARAFAAGNASSFLLFATVTSSVFFMSQFLQVGLGNSPLAAGVRMMPWTAAVLVVAPLSGRLADRVGPRWPLAVGLLCQALGLGWIALAVHAHRGYVAVAAGLIVAGCGVTMAMPAAQSAIFGSVPTSAVGQASGTFNTLRQLAGVFGIATLAAIFTAHGSYASAVTFRAGFIAAIAVAAGISLLGALIGLSVPSRARPATMLMETAQVTTPVGAHAQV